MHARAYTRMTRYRQALCWPRRGWGIQKGVFALERRFLAIIVLKLPQSQELPCDGCSGFGD